MRNLEMKMPGRKKTGEDEQYIIIYEGGKRKTKKGGKIRKKQIDT